MLNLYSGPFHPSLENAFKTRVKLLKKNPLTPLLIISPSARLLDRIQQRIVDDGSAILSLTFHTFTSLAEQVVETQEGLSKPVLSDPQFFDTLLKVLLKKERHFQSVEELAVPDGFPNAVRSTLRDLIDAGINEENVEQAIHEEFLGQPVDLGSLRELLRVYHSYLKQIERTRVYARHQLLKKAIDLAPESDYLKGFSEILFYGFYDLTGLQADLFEAVSKNHPSSFFFPYVHEHPDYAFSKLFRDTFVQRLIGSETHLKPEPFRPELKFMNVSGHTDEAWVVATEILRFHAMGIPYTEMAVVARSAERLKQSLPAELTARSIPFRTTARESLASYPLAQLAYQLLELTDHELSGRTELDFLRSPEFIAPEKFEKPTGWPETSSWSDYAKRFTSLLEKHFTPLPASRFIWDAMIGALEGLSKFDLISKSIGRNEFLETLWDRWQQLPVSAPGNAMNGVSLLHAEAARGLSFKAVIVIGLEERVFPRIIREDPFLRDDARFALNQTLGHKINRKLTAFEEERLLFELITTSAESHLVLMYQRSDEGGAVVGASPFLRSFAEAHQIDLDSAVVSVPRPSLSKWTQLPPSLLKPSEQVSAFLLDGKKAEALELAKSVGGSDLALKRGIAAMDVLQSFSNAGPYDGLLGPQPWESLFPKGTVSPTSLETYGQCPSKFFFLRVLGLKPMDELVIEEELASDVKGEAVHLFLEKFYRSLTAEGSKPLPEAFPEKLFDSVFSEVFDAMSPASVNLHPVLWEATKINLRESVREFVRWDLEDCRGQKWQPTYFEKEITAELPDWPGIKWNGKIDRIDVQDNGVRIVDYKTGRAPKEKNVTRSALKGSKLQAPLYLMMAERLFQTMKKPVSDYSFSYLYMRDMDDLLRHLSSDDWKEGREEISKALQKLLRGLQTGRFLIKPGDYCSFCEVASICRSNHGISMARARGAELS